MIKAYTIPHSAGMPDAMVKALTRSHAQTIKLTGQIAASKALASFVSMREMRSTQRGYETAGVPLQKTRHGVIVPLTPVQQIIQPQQKLLTQAQDTTGAITGDYLASVARSEILTGKVTDLFAEVRGLKQELRDRPVLTETKPFWDFSFPSLGDLKTPLIIAAVAVGGLLLLPSLIGVFKK